MVTAQCTLTERLVPGHGFLEHGTICSDSPRQSSLVDFEVVLIQYRVLPRVPLPHVTEQEDHTFQ